MNHGTPRFLGLLGNPVAHSVSPAMHNAGFRALGLDAVYLAFDVPRGALGAAIYGLQALGAAGFNLTIPHKEAALKLLDDLAPAAAAIGAVNTVVRSGRHLVGHNTDAGGFTWALREEAGLDPRGRRAVILGAGGFARAVAYGLREAGAEVQVVNRSLERARLLAESLGRGITALEAGGGRALAALREADLVVNATPLGMHPAVGGTPLEDLSPLKDGCVVVDGIFNPLTTRLVGEARHRGLRALGGLGTLVRQGALAWPLWFGREAPLSAMEAAARDALGAQA